MTHLAWHEVVMRGVLSLAARMSRVVACVAVLLMPSMVAGAKPRKIDNFGLSFNAPPVIAYLENQHGEKLGIDFTRTLTPWGEGEQVKEIPGSSVFIQNIASDDVEDRATESQPQLTTKWSVGINDGGSQTYTLVVEGLTSGVGRISCRSIGTFRQPDPRIKLTFFMLVTPGVRRQVLISVDRSKNLLSVSRQVSATFLAEDLDLACLQGYIQPEGVCQSLRAKVAAVTVARQRGSATAAKGAVNAFLNELKAQAEKHVKEPVLTILREEAEALLNPPPPLSKPKVKSKTTTKAK